MNHISDCEINHPLYRAYIGCTNLTDNIDLQLDDPMIENILDWDYQDFRSHWYDLIEEKISFFLVGSSRSNEI